MYPKLGPGQMWEEVTAILKAKGVAVHMHHAVIGVETKGNAITSITTKNSVNGEVKTWTADYIFSTMAIKDLIHAMGTTPPKDVRAIAEGLQYRDFITVGLLLNKLKITNTTRLKTVNNIVPDNWIYIQEPDVRLCRLQIFNNWSPYMVKDPNTIWIGLEYMLNETDDLWKKSDGEFAKFAIEELARIGIVDDKEILDQVVIRVLKAYPAYFGTYDQFKEVRAYLDGFPNLFCVGRNGMHRYNNQDHSMMTAIVAVENIINGVHTKDNLWSVNVEKEYHEEKTSTDTPTGTPKTGQKTA